MISSLEGNKNFSKITIWQKWWILYKPLSTDDLSMEESMEGNLEAQTEVKFKNGKVVGDKKETFEEQNNKGKSWKKFPPWSYSKKKKHTKKFCWFKLEVRWVCNQLGFIKTDNTNKDKVLRLSYTPLDRGETLCCKLLLRNKSRGNSLIESGCTIHVSHNTTILKS